MKNDLHLVPHMSSGLPAVVSQQSLVTLCRLVVRADTLLMAAACLTLTVGL